MPDFKVGDIVIRKSYGGDIYFRITEVINNSGKASYVLRGLSHRLMADSSGYDLEIHDPKEAYFRMQNELSRAQSRMRKQRLSLVAFLLSRLREKPGRILHIDSDSEYLNICMNHYREANLSAVGKLYEESSQPDVVRHLLETHRPDLLVLTGHDSMKKGADKNSLDSYRTSRYFIRSVKEARKYQPSYDKLCIFAGACQSYYEGIMAAGANFASSPGRILINVLDPAVVTQKIAVTDSEKIVSAQDAIRLTVSGSNGVGGIDTRGHLIRY